MRNVISGVVFAVVVSSTTLGSASPTVAAPMDMNEYCRENFGPSSKATALDRHDASSWRCRTEQGLTSVSLSQLCKQQYGSDYAYALGDARDAASWSCVRKEPMDMNKYCRDNFGSTSTATALDRNDASSWRCRSNEGLTGISLSQLCQQQYGSDYTYNLGNPHDASSWSCLRKDNIASRSPSPTTNAPESGQVFSVGDGVVVELVSIKKDGQEIDLITLEGELKPGDNSSFAQAAIYAENAIVILSSPGGDLQAGMEIGEIIRIKEYSTLVPKDFSCASVCALAWLAGQPRYMEPGARIGFHAPRRTDDPTNRADSAGSALVGAYLSKLGLPSRAIAYFTEKQPDDMQWLTLKDADRLGIYVKEFRQ